MRYLCIDCDDTLVLWHDEEEGNKHPYGRNATGYDLNEPLIQKVKDMSKDNIVLVWSGGGKEYAAYWAEQCFGNIGYVDITNNKDIWEMSEVAKADDVIVVDDDQGVLDWFTTHVPHSEVFTPEGFINEV